MVRRDGTLERVGMMHILHIHRIFVNRRVPREGIKNRREEAIHSKKFERGTLRVRNG